MIDLQQKLKSFAMKRTSMPDEVGIVLPRAFVTTVNVAIGPVPKGASVIAEPNLLGRFALTWWDDQDRSHSANATREQIDIEDVYATARAALLKEISTHDLEGEIARRRATEAEVAA